VQDHWQHFRMSALPTGEYAARRYYLQVTIQHAMTVYRRRYYVSTAIRYSMPKKNGIHILSERMPRLVSGGLAPLLDPRHESPRLS